MTGSTRFNITWMLVEKLLRVLIGAVVSAAVARHLGPEAFGSLAVSIGIVSIAIAAANMGADHIHVSEFAQRQGRKRAAYLGSGLLARLIWSLFCLFVFLVAMLWQGLSHRSILFILSLGIPISLFNILAGEIQGRGAFGTYSILSCVSIAFGAFLRVAGIWYEAPLEFFALMVVAEAACMSILLLGWYHHTGPNSLLSLRATRSLLASYFKMCIPTALSATLVVLYLRFELFLVNELIGTTAAGIWSAALMFTVPWGMVAATILPVANRRLATTLGEGATYENRLVTLLRWMLLLAATAAIINCTLVAILAPLLLGPEFNEVAPIVSITSLSFIPLFSGSVQDLSIAHRRTTGTVLKKVLVGLPISATLYYLFVPTYGLRGAAVAMVSSYIVTAVLLNIILDKPFFRIQLRALGFRNA